MSTLGTGVGSTAGMVTPYCQRGRDYGQDEDEEEKGSSGEVLRFELLEVGPEVEAFHLWGSFPPWRTQAFTEYLLSTRYNS